jgi:hypothetical protein
MATQLKPITTIRAKSVSVGQSQKIRDMTDVDLSEVKDGSILIYSEENSNFKAKNDLDEQNIEGGHY